MKIIQMHNATISQMMGYLLITENGKLIVVDGGTEGDTDEFIRVVKRYGDHIDLWLLTHPHSDHVGVFWELVKRASADLSVDRVCYSPAGDGFVAVEAEARNDVSYFMEIIRTSQYPMQVLKEKDVFRIDHVTIEILRVVDPKLKRDYINNLSLVFKVTEKISAEKDFTMMFLGDLGESGGVDFLENYADNLCILKADAVQMAHHGQCGVGFSVYEAISPKWSFWPTPDWLWDNTPYGSPCGSGPWKTLEVRAWMERLGAKPVTSLEQHVEFDTVSGGVRCLEVT